MMLTCDRTQPRHYGDEQGRYWSVSQVCEVVAGRQDFYAAGAAERGTDVHLIFALAVGHHAGKCEAPDVPTEYAGYHRAILKWIAWANPKPAEIERRRKHHLLPYAGQMDFVGNVCESYGVLDLKTGQPMPWHRVQIEAYQKLVGALSKRWVLYIDADGEFKQVLVKPSARDWAVFQNGLSILQWRAA